jgi:ABC-type multidrug transport system ATPase subunit
VVSAAGLCKSLDDRAVLRQISFEASPGEFIALLGANGAGKSTLLKVVSTLTKPDAGELRLFGQAAGDDPVALRQRIGLVGHQSMLYRELTARENLLFFGKLYGVAHAKARAAELLERVALSDRADDPVKAFSRGMLQRVAIARALMHEPELILADEPFSGLDTPSAVALEKLLAELAAGGRTILLVNHDIEQSLRLAGRIMVLSRGSVVLDAASRSTDAASVLREVCR